MSETEPTERESITVGETADGESFALPIEEVLTGRGAILGKSGSGKSNTASVVIENLLDGYGCLVVDVDGEYYGLKEQYQVLQAGADEDCDIQVGPEHAEKLASLALEEHVPIVLDVSAYVDEGGTGEQSDEARELVRRTAEALFRKEKELQRPFLLVVEEIHEFVPEGGGLDAVGQQLVQIGKRGRKRGLGLVGASQRPADVSKDFITQADWIVWHRVTWNNDTREVKRVLGSDYEEPVQHLGDGEAFVMVDWAETIQRVQFDRKQTFDAGATPGLEAVERPDLKAIDDDLVDELADISDREAKRRDEIERLEATLAEKDDRIAELEQDLKQARDVSNAAQQFAAAVQGSNGDDGIPEDFEAQLAEKNERINELEAALDERDERIADLESEVERVRVNRERVQEAEQIEERFDSIAEHVGALAEELGVMDEVAPASVSRGESEENEQLRERVDELEAENETLQERLANAGEPTIATDYEDFVEDEVVQEAIQGAKDEDNVSEKYVKAVVAAILEEGEPVTYDRISEFPGVSKGSNHDARAARALEARRVVTIDERADPTTVDFNLDGIREVKAEQKRRHRREQIMEDL